MGSDGSGGGGGEGEQGLGGGASKSGRVLLYYWRGLEVPHRLQRGELNDVERLHRERANEPEREIRPVAMAVWAHADGKANNPH